ncbi:phytoene desaturase [bacterium]|nr:phytoene desaturase [bacterium]
MVKQVAVIGGGMGGLSGAIRLARMGFKVFLYEKNEMLGGKMGRIQEEGFTFDTGPTLLTMPFIIEELFQFVDSHMTDKIQLAPIDPVCRYFFNDTEPFDASSDIEIMNQNINQLFHGESENYIRFLRYAERIYKKTSPLFIFSPIHEIRINLFWQYIKNVFTLYQIDPLRTVHQSVKRYFQDPRLIQLFDRYATYNGSDPYRAPATLNVIPYVELGLGGYYIKGGLYRLVEILVEIAEKHNVHIHTGKKVERILHDNHRVKGVQIDGEKMNTDIVLCNGDVVVCFNDLIKGFSKTTNRLNRLEPSLSGMIFFWGIQGCYSQLKQHNIIFSQNYKKEFTQLFQDQIPPDDPTVYISISSKQDHHHAPEGCENWFVMINMPYLYNDSKAETWQIEQIRHTILQKLKRYDLDIEKKIQFERTITPQDIAAQFYSNHGSIYGISSNTIRSAFKRPSNRNRQLRGLYFAGGSAHPGGGVPMCMLSGKFAAELINEFEGN